LVAFDIYFGEGERNKKRGEEGAFTEKEKEKQKWKGEKREKKGEQGKERERHKEKEEKT
jgi:hypothetical protein